MTMRFKIDEEGFIKLLRRDIYNRDDVYIRELLQNAIDARATHVEVCMHMTKDGKDVVALSCCDDGLGMTKAGIADQFLNLCKRHPAGETNMFRRFGIGIFTYLAFCQEVHISTMARGGKAWYLEILGKGTIQSLDDISVGDLVESHREDIGTTVHLVLREKSDASRIIRSLQYWIRAQLPATVLVFESPAISAGAETIPSLAEQARAATIRHYDVAPTDPPPTSAHVLRGVPGVRSGFLRIGSRAGGLALCEGGMLIEEDVSELAPRDLSDIPFSGVIDMLPGWLDLDAGRSRVRRESRSFGRLHMSLASKFSDALANHIKNDRYQLTDSNFTQARIVRQALRSSEDPAELLKKFEESLFFHVLGHGEMPLNRMATLNRSTTIYSYSGDSWYWIVSMGTLKGHDTQLHVTMKSNASVVSASGSVVFILPAKEADGEIIDKQSLEAYFSRFYGKRLRSLGGMLSPAPNGIEFPPYWRDRLSIPATLSIAATIVPGTLFFDSRGNALISRDESVIRSIDSYLKETEEVPAATKHIIESYLNLLSGKMPASVSKIEAAVLSAIRPQTRTRRISIREVIDEIER